MKSNLDNKVIYDMKKSGISFEQIAKELNVTQPTVKYRYERERYERAVNNPKYSTFLKQLLSLPIPCSVRLFNSLLETEISSFEELEKILTSEQKIKGVGKAGIEEIVKVLEWKR